MAVGTSVENVRSESAHEPSIFGVARAEAPLEPRQHRLDMPDAMRVHARILDWWYTALDAHFDNRVEQALDYDFYDHIQWSEEDKVVLAARHQAPLTYNKIKIALDWVIGTERRTRIDGVVHPRTEDDVELAQVKGELLKYLSDTNRVPWERSAAFKDSAIVGVGWTEETIRADRREEPVMVKHVPWRQMRWDPFSRANDLSDARFVFREKYVDLEYAEAMFPDRIEMVQRAARDHLHVDDYGDQELDLPQVWRSYDSRGHEISDRKMTGRVSVDSRLRLRVRLRECWFRRPVPTRKLWGGNFRGDRYNPEDAAHREAMASIEEGKRVHSLTDGVTDEVWCAIFTDEGLLQLCPSPFQHGQFPFTPYWCYRRDRDGLPYGLVRGVRDSQEDLNKRMSKLLWAISTNQLFWENGAIDPERIDEVKRELAKPNGVIPLNAGGLAKIRVERNLDVAESQLKLLELNAAHIHDGSGVNREMLGRDTNAASGRAIIAKQQEGAVTTAELMDNYRLGIQLSSEKQLSLTEQYMTEERQFRIVGAKNKIDWRAINKLRLDTLTNEWKVENDITKSHADFVIDQQDFRESMRQSYAEQFFDMLKNLDPRYQEALLDIAIDMTDAPMKSEAVRRVQKLNGQGGVEGEESPEAIRAREAEEREAEISVRERLAKIGLDEARTNDLLARSRSTNLNAKRSALDIAQLLDALLPLAPAADRLYSDGQPTPVPQPPKEDVAHVAA